MVINTDNITTITGTIAALSGTLAGYGIAPTYTLPVAGTFGTIYAIFTKGISFERKF